MYLKGNQTQLYSLSRLFPCSKNMSVYSQEVSVRRTNTESFLRTLAETSVCQPTIAFSPLLVPNEYFSNLSLNDCFSFWSLTIQANKYLVSVLPCPQFVPGFSCGRKGNPAPLFSHGPFFRGFIPYTGTLFFFTLQFRKFHIWEAKQATAPCVSTSSSGSFPPLWLNGHLAPQQRRDQK